MPESIKLLMIERKIDSMKVLVVGSGGREHAIVWAVSQSSRVSKIYCAPGNAGISQLAECVPIKVLEFEQLADFAEQEKIDLIMVAPDDPLCLGAVDYFTERGLRAFGPVRAAAEIEGSKVFAKNLMKKYNIPTAAYEVFDSSMAAKNYLRSRNSYPAVIKAEGLALGKGVIIAQSEKEAFGAVDEIMEDRKFGDAGSRVVIEEFLTGQEVSVLAFTDGKTIVPMVSAQDHKRAKDGDEGLNTGGMGTFSPSRLYTKEIAEECMQNIFLPTMNAMNAEGRTFRGVLYFGLIMTEQGVKVIEYNSRFGDPEAQVVLPRLDTDLLDIFDAVIDGRLSELEIKWKEDAAVCVVLASGGYPEQYTTGYPITGMEEAEKLGAVLFHAGTKFNEKGQIVTAGGRVLGVTAMGENLDKAIANAYKAVKKVHFENMHYRTDIGVK